MTRWKAVSLLLTALTLGALGFMLARPKQTSATAEGMRGPLACRLSVGEELAFQFESTSEGRKPNAPKPEVLSLGGEMWWRVLEERPGSGWVVAVAMSKTHFNGGPSDAAIEAPFLVHVGRDCKFREFAFDPTTQTETRQRQEGLIRAMEVILSPLPAAQWVSRHKDALGAFDATYVVAKERKEGNVVVTRKRSRYDGASLPTLPTGRMRVEVKASDARFALDPKGRWLRELDDRETVRIFMGQRVVSDLSTSTNLSRIEGEKAPQALASLELDRFAWGASAAAAAERRAAEPPPVDPALAVLDVTAALDDFAKRLGQGPGSLHQATSRLAGYLAAHPEAIEEILGKMRRGDLTDELHAPFFLALEKTGTPAAERALKGALADTGLSVNNRVRAAAALQDIPRPSERTAQALITQAREVRGDGAEKQVSDAALLSLGALSQRVADKQPQVAQMAREHIRERLTGARESEDVAVVLDAIGNSGDEDFAETALPYTRDSSPLVRAHAAEAYRAMDRETMEPVLVDWLKREPEPTVRRSIAGSLAERVRNDGEPASEFMVATAAAALATEPDAQVRAALIALLGSAAATSPSAKLALIQHFQRETVVELKVLIGRFVGAQDLL